LEQAIEQQDGILEDLRMIITIAQEVGSPIQRLQEIEMLDQLQPQDQVIGQE
jgi:hypothetical protein